MVNNKLKIINITGWGRNGSTLLGKILGELDGFFYAGEVRNIWHKALLENRLCGCGVSIRECNLWRKVFERAYGNLDTIDICQMKKLSQVYARTRYIPFLLLPIAKNFFLSRLQSYVKNLERLFYAIQEITRTNVIIDSSKSSFYGYLLSKLTNVDLYTIHLVRDPRGIAYSRQKRVIEPDPNETIYMKQYNSITNSLMWNIRNLSCELLWKKSKTKCIMIRYEDFISNPKETISSILGLVKEKSSDCPFTSHDEVKLGENHTIWGNPTRFQKGTVKLKLDEEWKEKLNKKDKIFSVALTFPLFVRYGYKVLGP